MFTKHLVFTFLLFIRLSLSAISPSVAAFQEGLEFVSYYENSEGHLLRYTHFNTPADEPKGSVVFIQGRSTFLEFYEILVVPLLDRGFDVWMYDLSGQGGSSRLVNSDNHDEYTAQKIQHVDTFDIYVKDAEEFINHVVIPHTEGSNLILGGYSTGAHVALRYLQKNQNNPFQSAFMISPLLALKAPVAHKVMSYLLWGASYFVSMESYSPNAGNEDPIFTLNFEGNVYTGSKNGFQQIKNLCIEHRALLMGGVSLGWLKSAIDSIEVLWKDQSIRAIQLPVLIATGGDDQLIDTHYNDEFVQQLQNGVHVYYPEGRHELFRETAPIRAQWWADFDAFFK